MKKLLLILIMMPILASAQVAEIVHYGNIAKDSMFTFVTTGHGYNSFFIVTDTMHVTGDADFDATIEILQGYDTLNPARVENGLITLSDTVNSERLIKGYTPHFPGKKVKNYIEFTKGSIDSTELFIIRSWHPY